MQQTSVNDAQVQIQWERKRSFYEMFVKRFLDIICSLAAIVVFGWLYLVVAVLVRAKLGSPVLFKQPRPGKIDPKTGQEKIFYMYKFRTMSNERDENGNLLPDEIRLGKFGKALRATSLDELPEAFNILKGDMSIIGPRPQLVRDMVFMTEKQRMRHVVRPGLSGLAQTRGRNALSWDGKLDADIEYIQHVSFWGDIKIISNTVKQVFFHQKGMEDSNTDEVDITDDFGDYLLKNGRVTQAEYEQKQIEAKARLNVKVRTTV
jgi:lipopolysaccharide/colanic/teichoic acid biosynthesis glycosyltransferase